MAGATTDFRVELDESVCEANGVAALVYMLLEQKAEWPRSQEFARQAVLLKPVRLRLTDTGEGCTVESAAGRLRVTADVRGRCATEVTAESSHIADVTQLRLLGRALIAGPFRGTPFWNVARGLLNRRIRIKGLLAHYRNALRFLWLINIRHRPRRVT
jgi:hypothetical protein